MCAPAIFTKFQEAQGLILRFCFCVAESMLDVLKFYFFVVLLCTTPSVFILIFLFLTDCLEELEKSIPLFT